MGVNNNAQTIPKHNFEKVHKITLTLKIVKNYSLRGWKFDIKFLIFEAIYQPFELKIHLKVGLLGPKTMPKQVGLFGLKTMPDEVLNNDKTTLKSTENDFLSPNMVKYYPWNGQNLTKNLQGHISTLWAENVPKSGLFKPVNNV